jgi:Family of unknown function (DUF6152)
MKASFGFLMFFGVVSSLSLAPALLAHHGNAAYDTGKTVTVTGTVTEWLWANPHCLLDFDVKDDKGNMKHYTGELSNPPDIMAHGWSKKMFKPGDEVTVTMVPGKNGEPIGRIYTVVVNGKTYEGGSPGRGPAPTKQ